jgi:hypothetical protein
MASISTSTRIVAARVSGQHTFWVTRRLAENTQFGRRPFGRRDGDDLPGHTNYVMPAHPAGRNACYRPMKTDRN